MTSFDDIQKSVLINIYFSDLEYTEISQQAKLEAWDLI